MDIKKTEILTFKSSGISLEFKIENDLIRLIGVTDNLDNNFIDYNDKNFEQYVFNQIQIAGTDRYFHRGIKSHGASQSHEVVFKEIKESHNEKGKLIEIICQSNIIKVSSFFQLFDELNTFSFYNEVTNISSDAICLEEVNSLFLYGIGGKDIDLKKTNLYIPTNSWHIESQWKKTSLWDTLIFGGNGNNSMKRLLVNNTGSWSTKEYLPMGILENETNSQFTLWQIEHNGSWSYEIGDHKGLYYLNVSGPDFENNNWSRNLSTNEVFKGVTSSMSFGNSLNNVLGTITKYRRLIRRKHIDNEKLPIIFNSYMHAFWDYPTETNLIPLIDKVATMGCDVFCIDAGWHNEDDWWSKLGDFEESKSRFPSGVIKTVDYIKSKGLKVGLWIEIENVGVNSKAATELPDECFFYRNGKRVINHERLSLDFRSEVVIERSNRLIKQLVDLGAEYIKMDYNIDSGIGTILDANSLGDGLLEHNRAFIKWIDSILDTYPNLTIESCASGGSRMDYSTLSKLSIQSTSDQTNYKKYPYVTANIFSAVTPEQSAVWSYPLENIKTDVTPETLKDETVIMNMINSLLGRIHLASRLDLINDNQIELIEEALRYYDTMRNTIKNSVPYMPYGFTDFDSDFVASGIMDDKKLYLAVWNLNGKSEVKLALPEINIKTHKIGYPLNSKIAYDLTSNLLTLKFSENIQSALFEIDLE